MSPAARGTGRQVTATQLGLWDALLPAFRRAGWLEGEEPSEPATELLLELRSGPDPEGALERLAAVLEVSPSLAARALEDPEVGRALVAVVGASRALSRTLALHPEWLEDVLERPPSPGELTGVTGHRARLAALRRFTRRHLLRIAMRDLLGRIDMPEVGRELSDVADAAARAALEAVVEEVRGDGHPPARLGVIAMGKWGGRELNYASDIDCLFVYRVAEGADPQAAAGWAGRVAEGFLEALGGVTPEGVAFRVDADLRPEGKDGPLARSLESYRAYYERWAQTWEFQALLKARPAAGDLELGAEFCRMVEPFVYPETLPPEAVREVRAMKARIESERIPPGEDPDFHLKLGPGGLVDVEFTVQLLQLRRGGRVPELRVPGTLEAIAAAERHGLLPLEAAAPLAAGYAFCGRVRNRLFLQAGRPRDSLPTDAEEATRLALSLGYQVRPRSSLREDYRRHTRRVRAVVEQRFYR